MAPASAGYEPKLPVRGLGSRLAETSLYSMASESEMNPNAAELGHEAGPTTSINPSSSWGESVRAELEARNREGDQRVAGLTREVDDRDLHPPYFEPQVFHDPAEQSSEGDSVPARTGQILDMGDMVTALDAALGTLPDLENEGEVAARRLEQSPGHRSWDGQSELSRMERGRLSVAREGDELELMPDYPACSVPPSQNSCRMQVPSSDVPQDQLLRPSAHAELMSQVGNLMQTVVSTQIAPIFQTLLTANEELAGRLERLEKRETRMPEQRIDVSRNDIVSPQAAPIALGPKPVEAPRMEQSQSSQHDAATVPRSGERRMLSDASHNDARIPGGVLNQGIVDIDGVPHAWLVTPEGLQLTKCVASQSVAVADVLRPRAKSPFTPPHHTARVRDCGVQESGQVVANSSLEKRVNVGSTARSNTAGLVDAKIDASRVAPSGERRSLSPNRRTQSPKTPVRVTRPTIVYPRTPGGTEIRPPPLPGIAKSAAPEPPAATPWGFTGVFGGTAGYPSVGLGKGLSMPWASDVDLASSESSSFGTKPQGPEALAQWATQEPEDPVRYTPNVPKLPSFDPKNAAIQCGDWLTSLAPVMGSLSSTSAVWWADSLGCAEQWYQVWVKSSPLDRTRMKVEDFRARYAEGKYSRVEQRAVALLLEAVTSEVREDIISNRLMCSSGIVLKIMTKYQPGGAGERAQLLGFLTTPQKPDGPATAVRLIRQWKRWLTRTREINVTPPDCSLQVQALEDLTPTIGLSPTAIFRLQTMKTHLLLDQAPSQHAVLQLAELLLAECEAASLADGAAEKKPKLKKLNNDGAEKGGGGGKGEGKGKGQGSKGGSKSDGKDQKPCVHWLKESGCPYGKSCKFYHDKEALKKSAKASKRCFVCSSVGHFADKCPTSAKDSASADAAKKVQEPGASADTAGLSASSTTPSPQAALLEETTKLLRSLQAKNLQATDSNAIKTCLELQGGSDWGLLDSGATTCLRPPFPGEDVSQYPEKRVELASGHTSLRVTPVGTLIGPVGTEVIVAMGCLVQLGCRVTWRGKQCTVIHPERGSLAVTTTSGCPKVSRDTAYELIRDIEGHRLQQLAHQLEARRLSVAVEGVGIRDVLGKLVQAFHDGDRVEPWIQVLITKVWPEAPEEVLSLTWTCCPENNHGVPYNRRQRKRFERAQALVLNLFAGATRKPIDRACVDGKAEQVPVDQEHDLLAPATFWYLLRLCSTGKVRAILAKPPCSTYSQCGSGESSSAWLRTRCGEPLLSLASAQRQKVLEADELVYRMFILMLVAQAANPNPQDPWTLISCPEDPSHYVDPMVANREAPDGYPSLWASPVYTRAAVELGLTLTHGDQGPYGHASTMPTTWASNKPLPHFTSRGPGAQTPLEPQATQASTSSDSWAPGILKHIADELVSVLGFDRIQKAAFDYEAHVKRGHWPPYRGCPQCVLGQACQRPHRRVRIPEAFSLSLDLAGPYGKGVDDISFRRRFALVGVYVLPLDRFGGPLLSEEQRDEVKRSGYVNKVKNREEAERRLPGGGVFDDDELARDLDE